MKNVLFVTEKWCASNPAFGFANYFDNLFITFSETFLDAKIHTLHFDESALLYGVHIDQILMRYCVQFNIDVIFFACGGGAPHRPSINTLLDLKNIGKKQCFIWYDNNPTELDIRDSIRNIIDLNVIIDYPVSEYHENYKKEKAIKDLYLWTPESSFYFHPDVQDISVSFIGSVRYADRITYIQKLLQSVPQLLVSGGQRENSLSFSGYSSLIRRSKINLNFSKNPQLGSYFQLKGRVLETISSKSLLIEEKNPATRTFFEPNIDYIDFETIEELIEKINFYLNNEEERIKIADNGYNKFINNYTAKHFWQKISEKLK